MTNLLSDVNKTRTGISGHITISEIDYYLYNSHFQSYESQYHSWDPKLSLHHI